MPDAPPAALPAVEDLIPHRGRFRLIDRLVRLEGQTVEAVGTFTVDHCDGHFPDRPVVPGVLLLEALAQTMLCAHVTLVEGGVDGLAGDGGPTPFLAGFEKVRFRAPVLPPAEVRYSVTLKEERFGLVTASGEARVDGRRVCTARLTAGILPDPAQGA
ncbi:MAG: beta-hydroxyacyl-ACP dehydratase [Alphaproteobacteria bacterium]|nr:beta-hydroxyacyl-ACP dehydratase [Alphaproteobacteria bacterium]